MLEVYTKDQDLVDHLSTLFPLNDADRAKLRSLDTDCSNITFAAVVSWYYDEDEPENPIRVTQQVQYPDLSIYDDRSEALTELHERIDKLEAEFWDRMQTKTGQLPHRALYLETVYAKLGSYDSPESPQLHLSDVFLIQLEHD